MTHEQHVNHKRLIPPHLFSAYDWVASAGEWDEAMAEPESYAASAAANAIENEQGDVTECDLLEVIYWRKANEL